MDNPLEQVRERWVEAFFSGSYEQLLQYEDEHFKVVYEQDGRVESSYTRYDRIAHAVENGVWKPRKPDVEFEEYDFDRDQTHCTVLIGVAESHQQIQEIWQYKQGWKITELRFLKQKYA